MVRLGLKITSWNYPSSGGRQLQVVAAINWNETFPTDWDPTVLGLIQAKKVETWIAENLPNLLFGTLQHKLYAKPNREWTLRLTLLVRVGMDTIYHCSVMQLLLWTLLYFWWSPSPYCVFCQSIVVKKRILGQSELFVECYTKFTYTSWSQCGVGRRSRHVCLVMFLPAYTCVKTAMVKGIPLNCSMRGFSNSTFWGIRKLKRECCSQFTGVNLVFSVEQTCIEVNLRKSLAHTARTKTKLAWIGRVMDKFSMHERSKYKLGSNFSFR